MDRLQEEIQSFCKKQRTVRLRTVLFCLFSLKKRKSPLDLPNRIAVSGQGCRHAAQLIGFLRNASVVLAQKRGTIGDKVHLTQ